MREITPHDGDLESTSFCLNINSDTFTSGSNPPAVLLKGRVIQAFTATVPIGNTTARTDQGQNVQKQEKLTKGSSAHVSLLVPQSLPSAGKMVKYHSPYLPV